jgi:signal transduction histidine kinase
MLTFSKEREPEPEPADLNEVTADVVELMQTRAADEGIRLTWKPDRTIPVLLFDPEALHRAILNIVTNAIDACQDLDNGRVEVSTQYQFRERLALVRVSDSGFGIEKDDLDKIFTVFVSRKGGRGTGLGLPVSQKIMQEHGGRIRVESTPGKGSTFTLELPATVPRAADADGSADEVGADQPLQPAK